jgi:hypothetical protein
VNRYSKPRMQCSSFPPNAIFVFGGIVLAAFAAVGALRGQELPALDGIWSRSGCVPDPVTCPMNIAALPLRARAVGFRDAFDEVLAPKYDCVQATIPSLINDPYNFAIEQLDDRLIFRYEKDDVVRTIWLDGHPHPSPGVYDFYHQGHSVGHYEGDNLVIETTRFAFDPIGLDDMLNVPSSTQKRVVERYWRDGETLYTHVVTEDRLFLLEPIEMSFEWQRTDTPLILPYGCDPEISKLQLDLLPPKYED